HGEAATWPPLTHGLLERNCGARISACALNGNGSSHLARRNPRIRSLYPMAQSHAELVKALVDAGVHFGHRVSRWNPKMEPYIHGKRNMIHIIDIRETIKGLLRAKKLVGQAVSQGKDLLVV